MKKTLDSMIYGITCFSLLFSLVGTILGGIWADQSWGRFWGWDAKENGALLIVIWNALLLHARFSGNRENPRSCLHCNFWKCGHILVLVWNKYAWRWPSFLRFYGQSIQLPNDVHHFTNGYYRSCLHPPFNWIFKKIIPAQSLHLITFAYHYLNCESL